MTPVDKYRGGGLNQPSLSTLSVTTPLGRISSARDRATRLRRELAQGELLCRPLTLGELLCRPIIVRTDRGTLRVAYDHVRAWLTDHGGVIIEERVGPDEGRWITAWTYRAGDDPPRNPHRPLRDPDPNNPRHTLYRCGRCGGGWLIDDRGVTCADCGTHWVPPFDRQDDEDEEDACNDD